MVKEGMIILLVSHDLSSIEKHCDKVIWLDKGKIRKEGKTEEVVGGKTKDLNTC